jgi:REP element-mobilizing transposase RayT
MEPNIPIHCDHYWFLTWTMYGNWLPGDNRGFASNVRDGDGLEVRHNVPGTEYDKDLPSLEEHARKNLICDPIRINLEQAEILLLHFQETAVFRNWKLFAVAIMANHCHVVMGVPGDPEPKTLLQSLKSYGSRAFNRKWKKPESGTWWTESGSKHKLPDHAAVLAELNPKT